MATPPKKRRAARLPMRSISWVILYPRRIDRSRCFSTRTQHGSPPAQEKCSWLTAFIDLVVVEKGEDVGAVRQAAGGFVALQLLRRAVVLVAPAALEHELVPHEDLLFAR